MNDFQFYQLETPDFTFLPYFLQTLRMGPSLMATNNPTWPSRVNQFNEGNSNDNNSGNNMVQSMSSTNSFSGTGVRTSVSMVSSNSNGGGAGKSGNGGWPVRLL